MSASAKTAVWYPVDGAEVIVLWQTATGTVKQSGALFADGLTTALVSAEMLWGTAMIAEGRIGPATPLGSQRATAITSRAQSAPDSADYARSTVYLATLGAVRLAHGLVRPAKGTAGMGVVPPQLAIVLGAVGIAAAVGGAWYARQVAADDVQIEATAVRAVAAADAATKVAGAAIAAGQPVPPAVLAALGGLAKYETDQGGFWWPAATAAAATVAVGAVAWGWWQGRRGGGRRGAR
jgi:hypothetical protein